MTKTNRSTLIATFLLGVLLYVILRFAADLSAVSDGRERAPPPGEDSGASISPRIATAMDLRTVLNVLLTEKGGGGGNSGALLDGFTQWSNARGFTGNNRLFGSTDGRQIDATEPIDEAQLRERSEAGDAIASQTLATRILFDDPPGSLELFRTAAEQGSTFALLRIGSLLEALETAGADDDISRIADDQRAILLAKQGSASALRISALGYLLTAARDGGPPIIDRALLAWLDRLTAATTNDELVAVCAWSERTLLDIARRRARWGKPAIATDPPPVFIAIPNLADRLPCRQTSYPIENLLDLGNCTVTEARDGADEPLELYLCPDN